MLTMKNIQRRLESKMEKSIREILDKVEDVENWDVHYKIVFPIKEKIKFTLADLASALPYEIDIM
jgi:hypothetical protein